MSWYVVTGKKGCQLRAGSLLSTPKVTELECGTRVRVEALKKVVSPDGAREIERCEIVLPVKGWASLRLLRREAERKVDVREHESGEERTRVEAGRRKRGELRVDDLHVLAAHHHAPRVQVAVAEGEAIARVEGVAEVLRLQ